VRVNEFPCIANRVTSESSNEFQWEKFDSQKTHHPIHERLAKCVLKDPQIE
jgi:hypothetical protein